jgi:hypothetical protein
MFQKGTKIHLHDGTVVQVRKTGIPKGIVRKRNERGKVRGFVRAAIVDPDGTEHLGDWHENNITEYGHQMIVRNYVGIASSGTSAVATNITDLALARYWAVGSQSSTLVASELSTKTALVSEYGTASNSTAGTGLRAAVSSGIQALSGTWTLTQSFQYASSHITNAATLNCLAQYHASSVGVGTAHSMALFASSTKGTTQALNLSYAWLFST